MEVQVRSRSIEMERVSDFVWLRLFATLTRAAACQWSEPESSDRRQPECITVRTEQLDSKLDVLHI